VLQVSVVGMLEHASDNRKLATRVEKAFLHTVSAFSVFFIQESYKLRHGSTEN
jgi:hypothetical protein